MSVTFTKLFSSITESTVWCEPDHVRILWITMLAMSDRNGRVWGSVPGLANRARITVEDTRDALKRFMSPDPDSRTPSNEGRRIEPIDGGWRLLNHEKYRSIRDEESIKESKRKYINARREEERKSKSVENVDRGRGNAEADTDADTLSSTTLSGKPDSINGFRKESLEILEYLNRSAGKSFRPVDANLKLIAARLKGGVTPLQMREVVFYKCSQWKADPKMADYLRPATLFNATKFEQYLGELGDG